MRTKSEYGKDGYISFTRLWDLLEKRGKNKQWLLNNGIHKATIYKLVRDENVTCEVIAKLCFLLNVTPKNIMDYIPPGDPE